MVDEYNPNSMHAQLAVMITKQDVMMASHQASQEAIHKRFERLEERQAKIEKQLSLWNFTINIVKFAAGALVLLLTLKVGDIGGLFTKLFHP